MPTSRKQTALRQALRGLALAPVLVVGAACTDLTETPRDALTPANAFKTDQEILSGVASVYSTLRGTMWGYYNLSEITTDEMIVPTRGTDWFDNGRWLEIHRQAYNSGNSASALDDMNGTWNTLFSGVARANLLLEIVQAGDGANKERNVAELRALRAWFYYMLLDFFGNVPLVTDTRVGARPAATRREVFAFVEKELLESRGALPDTWDDGSYGRVTKGAANAMLASLYLNAQVFDGTLTDGGLQRGPARWQDAINAADAVINSPAGYRLRTDSASYRNIFTPNNKRNPEHIFVLASSPVSGLGISLAMRGLHYNQLNPSPWNGFATLAESYNRYDPADARRAVWLVGQQRSFNTGQPVTDRAGAPLVFTVDIENATSATEAEGPRPNKYVPLPNAVDGDSHPNDYAFFRISEMHLIKAEALNELGRTGEAIAIVNQLRAGVFTPPRPLSAGLSQAEARQAIFNERQFELAAEGKRRQDMIRAGTFLGPKKFKPGTSEPYKVVFPIPQVQLASNPQLRQNPGYPQQ